MDKIVEIIKKYKEVLNHNKELESTKISILRKIKKGIKLSTDEIRALRNIINEIPKASEIDRLPYIIRILECNLDIKLDDSQRILLENLLTISNSKYEETTRELDGILDNISNGIHLSSEQVTVIQSILFDKVNKIELTPREKIEFIKTIVRYNASVTSNKEETEAETKEVVEEKTEKQTNEIVAYAKDNDRLVPEDELRSLFKEFKYNYDKLDEEFKMYLRSHVNIDKLSDLLTILDSYSIRLFTSSNIGRAKKYHTTAQDILFTRILCYSSPELIKQIKVDFEDELIFRKFVMDHPSMLFPRIIGSTVEEPESGYSNYVKNKEFFKSKGFDFDKVTATAGTILTHNPDTVISNYHVISNKYKISFKGDSSSMKDTTGLYILSRSITTCLETIDQIIEADPLGYQCVFEHPTKISYFAQYPDNKRRLKMAYSMGKTLLKNKGKFGLCFITSNKDDDLHDLFDESYQFGSTLEQRIVSNDVSDVLEPYVTNREAIFADLNNNGFVSSNKLIDYLEANCKENEFLYSIPSVKTGGINTLISRQKVIRILNILSSVPDLQIPEIDVMKFTISFKSLLTADDKKNIETLFDIVFHDSVKMGGV